MYKHLLIILIAGAFALHGRAQNCNVDISPEDLTIDCGETVDLYAVGLAANPSLSTDFDGNSIGAGWSTSATLVYDNPCGPSIDGTPSAWFGDVPLPRKLTSNGFDVSCGAEVCFDLDFADDDPCGGCSDCEDPDQPDEGVFFQYSTDGGTTWTDLFYFDPTIANSGYYSWNTYCFTLPPAALSANTMFQWQQSNISNTGFDHWGIDNVSVTPTPCGYYYDWDNIAGSPDNQGQTVQPTSTTTYSVDFTDGTDVCTDDVTITVNPFTATASATNTNLSCGDCTDLDVTLDTPLSTGSVCQEVASVSGDECSPVTAGIYNLDCIPSGATITSVEMDGILNGNCLTSSYDLVVNGTVISSNNCSHTDLDLTAYMPITSVEIVSADEDGICNSVQLDLVLDVSYTITPNYTYSWTPSTNMTGVNSQTPNVCPTASTTYTGTIVETNTGCTATDNIAINYTGGTLSLNCPAQLTADCDISEQPPYTSFSDFQGAGGTATTTGSSNVLPATFTMTNEVSDGNTCPETVTRTYQIDDDCGNTETCTQTIEIHDLTAPSISGTTSPSTVSGCAPTAAPAPETTIAGVEALGVTIDDNCTADANLTVTSSETTAGTCPIVVTRTYSITDECGNISTVDHIIDVVDTQAPTITGSLNLITDQGCTAADATPPVTTVANLEAMGVTIGDNCSTDADLTVTSSETSAGTCPLEVTRTYTIEDACGNTSTVDQTLEVEDNQDPTASNPATTTVQCASDVPVTDPSVVTDEADNCTANPTVTFDSQTSDNNICDGEELTRIYEITDNCGNTSTVTHTIVIDSYTPTFTVAGTDPTTCGGTDGFITISGLDPNTDYTMEYNGNAAVTITTDGAGEYVITGLGSGSYTGFTVSDIDCPACSTTDGSTITLNDPNPPAVDAGPDQEVCDGSTVTLTADNPDGATISWDNGITDGTPFTPAVGTTTYTVTADLAGCINTDQVDITAVPAINNITCPGGLTAVCDITEQPAYADFDAFIADGGSASIPAGGVIDSTSFTMISEVSDGNACPETVTRTYQIEDTCGVAVTCTQDIVINDLIDPTGTAPADVTVQCIGDVPAADPTLIIDEADNCTANPTVTHVNDDSDGNTCPEEITRTYRIEDNCGNFIEVDQIITVNDDTDPVATAPADQTVQCIGDVPVVNTGDVTGVSDNCTATPAVTHVGDVSDGNTCPEEITRTYRIEDDCGNFIEVDQIITVDDDIAPTASNPATTTVQCASDVPATDPTVVTDEADNCTANPTVTFDSETSDNNVCDGEELTRVYEIADDCGNTTTVTHTIIIDAYTPTFTVAGTDPTTCGGTDGYITISGLDPNTDYDLGYNGNATNPITTDGAGEYVINNLSAGSFSNFAINPTSCDLCVETVNTNINLVDPNAPPVDAGPDQTICIGETVTLTATNPNNANISWDSGVTDGDSFAPPVGTNNYTVTAEEAGCTSTDLVVVTVNPLPNVNAGNDIFICDGESVTLSGSGADSYTWDNGVNDGVSFTPGTTTTYTVTGVSTEGCSATDDLMVTIYDNPAVDFEADVTEGCIPQEVNFTNLTSGNSDVCTWEIDGTTINDNCSPSYTFTNPGCYSVSLTVTSDDGCTDSYTETNYICIDDYPVADFSADPNELTRLENEVNFENQSTNAETYAWNFDDGETSTATHPSHTFPGEEEDEFLVELIATSQYGCEDTAYQKILMREELLYYVPNSFTPDRDQFNEKFKPVFTSGFNPQDYTLMIFNRWGEIIFESNHPEVGWDGTYGADSEEIVKDGTYIWKIEFKTKYNDERKVELGHVNVLR